jgi:hypothetical protein
LEHFFPTSESAGAAPGGTVIVSSLPVGEEI